MSNSLRNLCLLCILLVGVTLILFMGQTPTAAFDALANEFLVNSYTTDSQSLPAVAMNSSGDFVVAWQSTTQAGDSSIHAQRYNASGVPQTSEFQVNAAMQMFPQSPAVAMDSDGDFVVVWAAVTLDHDSTIISAQRYNAAGILQGSAIVTIFAGTEPLKPAVAMDTDGDFVVVWQRALTSPDIDVYARRFNALGVTQGTEFVVHSASTAEQSSPRVAMDAAGTFIVTWTHRVSAQDFDIYARHFDAAGVAQANQFRVNTYTTGIQSNPAAAADSIGNYIVTWQGAGSSDDTGQYAQRYNSDNIAQGSEFRVNTTTVGVQAAGYVAMSDDGKFLITWENNTDMFGLMYDAAGAPLSNEFMVNQDSDDYQGFATAAMNATGNHVVVAWTHYGVTTNAPDVYARRFSVDLPSPTAIPSSTPFSTFTTTINENEFYTAFEEQRAAFPNIAQGVTDFVPNGMNITVRLNDGETGIVNLTVSNADGFIVINISSIGRLFGGPASENYIAIMNRDLATLITATLDEILVGRFSAAQDVESVVINSSVMTLTLREP